MSVSVRLYFRVPSIDSPTLPETKKPFFSLMNIKLNCILSGRCPFDGMNPSIGNCRWNGLQSTHPYNTSRWLNVSIIYRLYPTNRTTYPECAKPSRQSRIILDPTLKNK